MAEVDRDLAFNVWEALDAGKTSYRIGEEGTTSVRTAQRLQAARQGFEGGNHISEIAQKTGWKVKRVEQLRGWYGEYRAILRTAMPPASPQPEQAPLYLEALREHRALLASVGQLLASDLSSLAYECQPVSYWLYVKDQPEVLIRAEHLPEQGVNLFPAFRRHVMNLRLWERYEALKEALVKEVERIFREQDEGCVRDYGGQNPEFRGAQIHLPFDYVTQFGNLGSRRAIAVHLDLPDDYDVVVEELNKELVRGIVGGHCEFCPG